MRWQKGRRSSNIEDRRGQRMGRGVKLGGGVTIIAIVAALFLGQDPGAILSILDALQQQTGAPSTAPSASSTAGSNDEASDFVSVVLADTEDTWSGLFSAVGQRYQPPSSYCTLASCNPPAGLIARHPDRFIVLPINAYISTFRFQTNCNAWVRQETSRWLM